MTKKKKTNPHCPVAGCQTTQPHADDPIVQGLILEFAPPEKMTLWARTAMAELSESICRDLVAKKVFAWHSRLRQPEELYIRTLNDGAHASFRAFMTCIGLARNPEYLPSPDKYCEHLVTYCKYLDYMHNMFKSGKAKEDVLSGVKNLHKPASHWKNT